MPNPWVSLRRDQLIPVNKAVSEKEQLEKGLEEEEKKMNLENATSFLWKQSQHNFSVVVELLKPCINRHQHEISTHGIYVGIEQIFETLLVLL
jgi:hypothetical protein